MSKATILIMCFIIVGISFLIMSVGCIKNKYIVILGVLLFVVALVMFMFGFKDVLFT